MQPLGSLTCPLLVASPEVKARREDAGEVEDVAEATSDSTLDLAEVTSGVGKLRASLIMLLREGLV
ncbi:hypothetical protein JG688_00015451, partial [Phytophthora aleatoria]